MNRFWAVVATLAVCFALFLVLAISGGRLIGEAKNCGCRSIHMEPQTLDPVSIADTLSDGVAQKVYNKLLRFERQAGWQNRVRWDLAESFTVTPDGKTYTFKLRKGVRFHNGREMKAGDAVYSLTRLLSPKSKRSELMAPFVVGSDEYPCWIRKANWDWARSATTRSKLKRREHAAGGCSAASSVSISCAVVVMRR